MTSPTSEQVMPENFAGPFDVDFNNSPYGRYVVELWHEGRDIAAATDFTFTASENSVQSFSLPTGPLAPDRYELHVYTDCDVDPFCPAGFLSSNRDFSVAGPVITPPGSPENPSATPGNSRATLRWQSPSTTGGAAIDRYQVQRGSHPRRSVAPSQRRYRFSGLRNGSRYSLRVRAHNVAGYGPWVRVGVRPVALFEDRIGDVSNGMDVQSVRVVNSLHELRVVTRFGSLRAGGQEVYVDTRKSHAGPEYLLATGVKCACDWEVFKMKTWTRAAGGMPLLCGSDSYWNDQANTVTAVFSRACVGHAHRVRVSVNASRLNHSGHDWAPRYRRFTPWVKQTH